MPYASSRCLRASFTLPLCILHATYLRVVVHCLRFSIPLYFIVLHCADVYCLLLYQPVRIPASFLAVHYGCLRSAVVSLRSAYRCLRFSCRILAASLACISTYLHGISTPPMHKVCVSFQQLIIFLQLFSFFLLQPTTPIAISISSKRRQRPRRDTEIKTCRRHYYRLY